MQQFLSEYVSYDGTRKAVIKGKEVRGDRSGYWIDMWENGQLVQSRDLAEHTEQYAKDCAENWIESVIK